MRLHALTDEIKLCPEDKEYSPWTKASLDSNQFSIIGSLIPLEK